jgi:hypothetical protein
MPWSFRDANIFGSEGSKGLKSGVYEHWVGVDGSGGVIFDQVWLQDHTFPADVQAEVLNQAANVIVDGLRVVGHSGHCDQSVAKGNVSSTGVYKKAAGHNSDKVASRQGVVHGGHYRKAFLPALAESASKLNARSTEVRGWGRLGGVAFAGRL